MSLADGGERKVYPTGAIKEPPSVEKGRYDLIPPGPLHRLAVHYARGAEKYPPGRTWEAGLPWSVLINSAIRHAFQWLAGQRDEDHLAAVAWQIFALMDGEARRPECCDIPAHPAFAVPFADELRTGSVEKERRDLIPPGPIHRHAAAAAEVKWAEPTFAVPSEQALVEYFKSRGWMLEEEGAEGDTWVQVGRHWRHSSARVTMPKRHDCRAFLNEMARLLGPSLEGCVQEVLEYERRYGQLWNDPLPGPPCDD